MARVIFEIDARGITALGLRGAAPWRGLIADKDAITRVAVRGVDIIKDLLDQRGTGRSYVTEWRTSLHPSSGGYYVHPIKKRRPEHTASVPGAPPARDYGTLLSSINFSITKSGPDGAEAAIFTTDDPAKVFALEEGIGPTPALLPRPFMRPGFEQLKREMPDLVSRSLRASIKREARTFRARLKRLFRRR